jgi:sterol desaturase/sphingolipid hydroxylase (fatty acid hydroxylase superfamily)
VTLTLGARVLIWKPGVRVGLAVSESFLELLTLQGDSYWRLQLFAVCSFFGLCFVGGLLTKARATAMPPAHRVTDMFHWLLLPFARMLSRVLVGPLLVVLGLSLGLEQGPALFQGFGPVAQQPRFLIIIEALVLIDLASYWSHRLFHTVPFLWRFHAIHHSATTITWSTTGRLHPINEVVNYAVAVIPTFLLGFPISIVVSVIPALVWYAIAAHSDWNPSFGPLRGVFASPRFHRWHHTMPQEGGNKNFSNIFSFWDRLFGTYYLPADTLPATFGLDGERMPENYLSQLAYPFRSKPAAQPTAAAPAATDNAQRLSSTPPKPIGL